MIHPNLAGKYSAIQRPPKGTHFKSFIMYRMQEFLEMFAVNKP